jgi:dsRNA-specific ribonuclease
MIGTQVAPARVIEAERSISSVGSNENLARVARQIGLDGGHIIVNPGHMGPPTDSMLATSVEAVLGAIYWDSRDEQNVRRATTRMGLIAGP